MFVLVNVLVFNLAYADNAEKVNDENVGIEQVNEAEDTTKSNTEKKSTTPYEIEGATINTEGIEEGIQNVADKGESLAYTIVQQISDKSLPVCAILILWGAVLYFILGIRNLYKKRQGLLLMWGAFTFVVIAKIMNFAFWFAFVR